MSLIDFIQKIQNKPRHVRLQILWLSVFVSMVLVVGLWLISLNYSSPAGSAEKDKSIQEISRPLGEIQKEIPSLMDSLKASFGSFFEENSSEQTEEQTTTGEVLPEETTAPEETATPGQTAAPAKDLRKIEPNKLPLSH